MVGLVVGVCRMVLEFAFPPPRCGVEDSAPAVLRSVHYLHFAILLCGLTTIVVIVVSLVTPPPTHDQVWTQNTVQWAMLLIHLQCYLLKNRQYLRFSPTANQRPWLCKSQGLTTHNIAQSYSTLSSRNTHIFSHDSGLCVTSKGKLVCCILYMHLYNIYTHTYVYIHTVYTYIYININI